ncbi:MAG TPA: hypothetical protein VH440_04895, partial [Candidatus Limnocylindrales bacterium]
MSTPNEAERRGRSPGLAAFLSFLWPGLGQWYAGARRSAVIFAIPVAIVVVVLASWLLQGPEWVVIQLLSPGTALTIAILIGLLGIWRLISMVDGANTVGGRAAFRRPSLLAGLAAMSIAVVFTHVALGRVALSFYDAGSQIFTSEPDSVTTPAPVPNQSQDVAVLPVATPVATPETKDSRINILFLGIDS